MKTQMRFQNLIFKISLVVAALTILFAFAFCTGAVAYIGHWTALLNTGNERTFARIFTTTEQQESFYELVDVYNLAQSYTDILMWLGIVFILLVVVCYIFANSKRRNYYAVNYITSLIVALYAIVWAVIAIYFSVQIHTGITGNFAWNGRAQEYAGTNASYQYSGSVWIYIVGYILAAIAAIDAVALVGNCIWKFMLMKGEKQLLANKVNVEEVKEVA